MKMEHYQKLNLKKQRINYLNEKTECNPCSFYGVSKLFGEKMFYNLSDYGIKILILRLFNVYGPGQDLKNLNQGMLSIYLSQLINSNNIIFRKFQKFRYYDSYGCFCELKGRVKKTFFLVEFLTRAGPPSFVDKPVLTRYFYNFH